VYEQAIWIDAEQTPWRRMRCAWINRARNQKSAEGATLKGLVLKSYSLQAQASRLIQAYQQAV
jgi:hypothetical protein